MTEQEPINLQVKDGDPRKRAYFSSLLHSHAHTVLPLWEAFGVSRKKILTPEQAQADKAAGHTVHQIAYDNEDGRLLYRREHMAPEHMLAGTAAVRALGQMLEANGHLEAHHVRQTERAFLVHDAGKELEVRLVNGARAEKGTAVIEQELQNPYVIVENPEDVSQLVSAYSERFDSEDVGVRAIAGYDLASDINELRLAAQGIPERIIAIQKEVAFTSDRSIEARIEDFNNQTRDQQALTIQQAIVHWVDDAYTNSVMDPNITTTADGQRLNTIDDRTIKVFSIPRNQVLDEAWKRDPRATNGEGAADMQRRVGHQVETFLANMLSVEDPLTLPQVVSACIEQNILNH